MGAIRIGRGQPLVVIAGPCVLEAPDRVYRIAAGLAEMAENTGLSIVFKASFDKANRTSAASYRGPGLEEGLRLLAGVRERTGLPLTTDIHLPSQAAAVAEVVDLIQIPAFLCRQTDLIAAAAATGRPVNLKKGQFMAPADMAHAVAKAEGAPGVLVTERGTSFGYRDLVVDMRAFGELAKLGVPVVFDATHSVQQPGAKGDRSGGLPEHIPALARAAVAAGVDAIFAEVHDDPSQARSDAATQLRLDALPDLLRSWRDLAAITRR